MEYRNGIRDAITAFYDGALYSSSAEFLEMLGYPVDIGHRVEMTPAEFLGYYDSVGRCNRKIAQWSDWRGVEIVCQLTAGQMGYDDEEAESLYQSYLFMALRLSQSYYDRVELESIVSQVNRIFHVPVMLIMVYGDKLSLGVTERRINKNDPSKEVIERPLLLYNISTACPDDEHLHCLEHIALPSLQRSGAISRFDLLHNVWSAHFIASAELYEHTAIEYRKQADLLSDTHAFSEALKSYYAALELDDTDDQAYAGRAMLLYEMGDAENAYHDALTAFEHNPNNDSALCLLSVLANHDEEDMRVINNENWLHYWLTDKYALASAQTFRESPYFTWHTDEEEFEEDDFTDTIESIVENKKGENDALAERKRQLLESYGDATDENEKAIANLLVS